MLTCRELSEKAQDYTDGTCSVWMRMRIRFHMAMCRNCAGFIDQTRKTKTLISKSLARGSQSKVSADLLAAFKEKTSDAAKSGSGGGESGANPEAAKKS